MSAPPGIARNVRDAAPRSTPSTWTDEDVCHVAFRLKAHGATEGDVRDLLGYWATTGVRRLRAFVDGIPNRDLSAHIATAAAELNRRGRGDLIFTRTPRRWPWRTSTSQPMGGAVA